MAKTAPVRMIAAASDHCPDMLYATRFFAPDAFLFLEHRGKRTAVLSDLEVDRGRTEAQVDEVLSMSEEGHRLGLKEAVPLAEFTAAFLKARKIKRVETPASFPLGFARVLEAAGIRLDPVSGLFWKEREQKSAAELKLLRRALVITEAGMARGIEVLRAAEVRPAKRSRAPLVWNGRPLTSELLRAEIDCAVLRAGGLPANTIVAGGEQACDPHERGSGPLYAHELIILDIFPRDAATGYYGDMTRTVVRGRASDACRQLWETVREGQKLALKAMKPGAAGEAIHEQIKDLFSDRGYPTERHQGRWRGFFHGTGHGLGLELHEEPRFARTTFKPGQVITVEPGIYWPGVGGARIEDVAAVTESGIRLLSRFPIELELQ